ncbi:MAG: hypothetical protein ACE5I1_07020 [bacterium]
MLKHIKNISNSFSTITWIVFITALLSTVGYGLLFRLGDVRPRIFEYLFGYFGVFLLYGYTSFHITNKTTLQESNSLKSSDLLLVLFFAVVFRFILLWDYPFLTDDIYRYLWDGRVWSHGVNPYLYAPASEQLTFLRDQTIHPNINHAEIPTIYAPVLQFVFRSVYTISPTFFFLKTVVTLFDLGVIALLLVILKILQKDLRLVLLYAWNPLVIVETAGSGHIDSIGVFFMIAFFLFFIRNQPVLGVLALAGAVLTKFIAVILLPLVLLRYLWKKGIALVCIFIAATFLVYLPFLGASSSLYKALSVYTTKWLFNASLFRIIYNGVAYFHPSDDLDANLMIAKYIVGVFFGAVYLSLFLRRLRDGYRSSKQVIFSEWFVLFGAICIVSPTLHPWYLVWLAPVLVIFPNRAWVAFTGLIFLSYSVLDKYYREGLWEESTLVLLAIYLPFYALLIFDFLQRKGWKRLAAGYKATRNKIGYE